MLLKLKMFLLKRDMTQGELAKKLGVTETHMSLIMKKKRSASFKMMMKFKTLFGIKTMDEVMDIFEIKD